MNLTKNFKREEFACKCGCGFDTIDFELLTALQHCVDRFKTSSGKKVSVIVNCGCRCKKHNDSLRDAYLRSNGKEGENTAVDSQHIYGRAADIRLFIDKEQVKPSIVAQFFDSNYSHFGIGVYNTFTHIDSRSSGKARW